MAGRRRRRGINLGELGNEGDTPLGEIALDRGDQEATELENGRFNMEDQRWEREEEESGPQGRRPTEGGPGRLEEMVQRLEVGNAENRRHNLGSFKPIKPKMYMGERNSVVLTRWIRETKLFLVQSQVEPDLWVMVSACFLDGPAQNWYMSGESVFEFTPWTEFKRELRHYFIPQNEHLRIMDEWRMLRQGEGQLTMYIERYRQVTLQLPHLHQITKLHGFLVGLKPRIRIEVEKMNPQTCEEAMRVAERIGDIEGSSRPFHNNLGSTSNNRGWTTTTSSIGRGTTRGDPIRSSWTNSGGGGGQPGSPISTSTQRTPLIRRGCFECGGPHLASNCPKKKQLTVRAATSQLELTELEEGSEQDIQAIAAQYEEEDEEVAVRAGAATTWPTCLTVKLNNTSNLFLNVKINGHSCEAMVDNGATHNFITPECAKKWGLKLQPLTNLSVSFVQGYTNKCSLAANVLIEAGEWKGRTPFLAVDMDGCEVILGLEWVDKYVINQFGKKVDKVLLDNEDGKGGIIVNMHRRNAKAKATTVTAKLCTGKVANRVLKKGGQLFLCTALQASTTVRKEELRAENMKEILEQYKDVLTAELPKTLPPQRSIDHKIPTIPGSIPPVKAPYRMNATQLAELKQQLQELEACGFIRPSQSPYGAPVIFVAKKDGTLRMCMDYRSLNKITIKKKYPLPLISDLLDQLQGARYFSRIDLRSGYHQIRVAMEDIEKTAFRTRYGSFEWLVMSFGLTGAPGTFCRLGNEIFRDYLDKFLIIYIDDLLIFSKTFEEHKQHVTNVLQRLQERLLYAKRKKCEFSMEELEFLIFRIGREGFKMDPTKVKAVQDWPRPTKVLEVQQFIGFVQYVRRFIKNFSQIATPLTNLIKGSQTFCWSEREQHAFDQLKKAVCVQPVLQLPDFSKPFEIHTDASDFAYGAVLMQDGHPIAYESKKFSAIESRWPTHEKEMLAIVYALRKWRHYVQDKFTRVVTDNISLQYFLTQPRLSTKQMRWQDMLAEFDLEIVHKKGKLHTLPDALSRLPRILHISVISAQGWIDEVRQAQTEDAEMRELVTKVMNGSITHGMYKLQDGLLWSDDKIVIPNNISLKAKILRELHDCHMAGHGGQKCTLKAVKKFFVWPRMEHEIIDYIRSCQVCQAVKARRGKALGLLQQMPVPSRPWDVISMDFIIDLPSSKGFCILMVIVDFFSKQAHFVPAKPPLTAQHVAHLFFKHVFKYHGLPEIIVSDRNPRFTSGFWQELFRILGTQLRMSSSAHPQTDGQTERLNQGIEDYIRCYVKADQTDWVEHIDMLEFCYNAAIHSSTGFSPFELATGKEVLTPIALLHTNKKTQVEELDVSRFLEEWKDRMQAAQEHLIKTKSQMINRVNKKREHVEFYPGDLVLVNSASWPLLQGLTPKFNHRFYGPYKVVKQLNNVSYKLQLPEASKIHDVFHVSLLKRFHPDETWGREATIRCEPEALLKTQVRRGRRRYFIKWRGKPLSEASWVTEEALLQAGFEWLLEPLQQPEP